jgi:glycosyltransferase involved in cell wall biosynthesis
MVYKVCVIIPCHNSELTLKNSIDSIINQTLGFENIKLILYDASTDSTKKIIEDYAEKFNNIVHKNEILRGEHKKARIHDLFHPDDPKLVNLEDHLDVFKMYSFDDNIFKKLKKKEKKYIIGKNLKIKLPILNIFSIINTVNLLKKGKES